MRAFNLIAGTYWGGLSLDLSDGAPIPAGWTRLVPPSEIPEGFYARISPDLEFELTDIPPVIEPAAPIFPTLTRKQLRNGLLSIGVTSAEVEAQIGTIADPIEREAAMIDWQDTQSYERDYPMINQIGVALGLPEDQIDALWMWSAGQ